MVPNLNEPIVIREIIQLTGMNTVSDIKADTAKHSCDTKGVWARKTSRRKIPLSWVL